MHLMSTHLISLRHDVALYHSIPLQFLRCAAFVLLCTRSLFVPFTSFWILCMSFPLVLSLLSAALHGL